MRHFLCSGQRGRGIALDGQRLYDAWQLIGPPECLSGELEGYLAYAVAFNHQRVWGMGFALIPENKPPKGKSVLCPYGCGKWFNNQEYGFALLLFLMFVIGRLMAIAVFQSVASQAAQIILRLSTAGGQATSAQFEICLDYYYSSGIESLLFLF